MSKYNTNNDLGEKEPDLFICPECRKRKMFRVKRTKLEKFVAAISFGGTANKKFFCTHCNRYIYTEKAK